MTTKNTKKQRIAAGAVLVSLAVAGGVTAAYNGGLREGEGVAMAAAFAAGRDSVLAPVPAGARTVTDLPTYVDRAKALDAAERGLPFAYETHDCVSVIRLPDARSFALPEVDASRRGIMLNNNGEHLAGCVRRRAGFTVPGEDIACHRSGAHDPAVGASVDCAYPHGVQGTTRDGSAFTAPGPYWPAAENADPRPAWECREAEIRGYFLCSW